VDLRQYVRGIGRRWKTIVACLIVALGVGWVVSPQDTVAAEPTTSYSATAYLLTSSSGVSFRESSSLGTAALLATLGEVPRMVAEEIDYEGDPTELAAGVQAVPDTTTQILKITATAHTEARAELLANTFAEQLIQYLGDRTSRQVDDLRQQIEQLDRKISRLSAQAPDPREAGVDTHDESSPSPEAGGQPSGTDIQTQIEGLTSQRQQLQTELTSLSAGGGDNLAGFEIVERATATPTAVGAEGLQPPRSRSIRLLIAAAIGLLLGLALALLLERLDTRIRTKQSAEEAYGLPVLAIIPTIGRRRRGRILADVAPRGPAANAFRLLAAALQFGWQGGPSSNGDGGASQTLLVTSGEPREGKSTVAANLAATFAEVGQRVIVLCCDYRHPTLHATFGVDHQPGLIEALEDEGELDLDSLLQNTAIEGVRVLATGRVPNNAGALLASERMGDLLARLDKLADVVVIDASPVLAASDWTQLIPRVDEVIVVARAGRTDAGSARRTAEVLTLLKAPVMGVVLNGVPTGLVRQAADRSWYRYQAPDRSRSARRTEASRGVTVLPEANGDASQADNGASPKSDEGIPHLARPAAKE
jgi:capsular exopolysaccharide synthesis family protein